MNLNIKKNIIFSNYYKKMNIFSFILIIFSIFFLIFKGLNLGVDFKGGTLIEIRSENPNLNITEIRKALLKMELGDVTVKNFGKDGDFLVKIEKTETNNPDFIKSINDKLSSNLGEKINFRRVL